MCRVEVEGQRAWLAPKADLVQANVGLADEVGLHAGEVGGMGLKRPNLGCGELIAELQRGHTDVSANIKNGANGKLGKPLANVANKVVANAIKPAPTGIADAPTGLVAKRSDNAHAVLQK